MKTHLGANLLPSDCGGVRCTLKLQLHVEYARPVIPKMLIAVAIQIRVDEVLVGFLDRSKVFESNEAADGILYFVRTRLIVIEQLPDLSISQALADGATNGCCLFGREQLHDFVATELERHADDLVHHDAGSLFMDITFVVLCERLLNLALQHVAELIHRLAHLFERLEHPRLNFNVNRELRHIVALKNKPDSLLLHLLHQDLAVGTHYDTHERANNEHDNACALI